MKIKILICSDDNESSRKIRRYLNAFGGSYSFEIKDSIDFDQTLSLLQIFEPNLVFFSVDTVNYSAFQLLASIKEIKFEFIILSKTSDFAIKGYDLGAADYLLVPFTYERFLTGVGRTIKRILTRKTDERKNSSNKILMSTLKKTRAYQDFITVKIGNSKFVLHAKDIILIKSVDRTNYVYWNGEGDKIKESVVDVSLEKIERLLNPSDFIRSHRTCLLKISEISSIYKSDGKCYVKLKNQLIAPLARKRYVTMSKIFNIN